MTMENRYIGSVKLFATADALGWITERVKSKEELKKKCGVDKINQFYPWKTGRGRFGDSIGTIEAGSYSDDTQLMLAVARSIKSDGNVDHNYFAKSELTSWYKYNRGAGNTVLNAAIKISRKSIKWNTNFFTYKKDKKTTRDYRDCGANGSAMRILSIALANAGNFEKIKENIFGNSIVTHGHPRAILGAILYGYAVDLLLKRSNHSYSGDAFLEEIITDFHAKFDLPFLKKTDFAEWIFIWNKNNQKKLFADEYKKIVDVTLAQLKKVRLGLNKNYSLTQMYNELKCFEKGKRGYGTSTVIAGLFVFCEYYKDPVYGITQAVNALESDTDTISAFTGGLFGALHGEDIIPNSWKKVQDTEYLIKVGKRLFEIATGSPSVIINQNSCKSKSKNINKIYNGNYNIGEAVFFDPLGEGKVISEVLRPSYHKGKEKLYLGVGFDIGQSCIFHQLIDE